MHKNNKYTRTTNTHGGGGGLSSRGCIPYTRCIKIDRIDTVYIQWEKV